MSGETDLDRLIAGLDPRLSETQYAFVAANGDVLPGDAFAMIREDEGLTIVRPGPGWARIMLGIHSSLGAVGLTARVATALAERGIAANVIAACRHDHVFVPWNDRQEAMKTLHALSES